MNTRRTVATVAALGIAPLALTALAASPAAAHGSMTDPVSRVSACFAEGPESPQSAACKAAVAASGAQAFYDWNEVNIADAAGKHREIIPDGKLCSAGRDKYKGLDLPRADWPASELAAGKHTFRYKATAPHKGSFELYVTKDGYDPSKPLKWSDLESEPFAKVTDPKLENGEYVFDGTVPNKSGRHLVYSIWQRSDSPEAFYTCSDVTFGGGGAEKAPAAPEAEAPSGEQIEAEADKSTVDHSGHGGDHAEHADQGAEGTEGTEGSGDTATANEPKVNGGAEKATAAGENLAETGGDSTTPYLAIGGAAALAVGAAALFGSSRRRAATGARHGR
ncbi:lytic polysaccharide monooxygenase auxiliary activity family 9 protein [Streptomyces boluensis]|uniref:LPXTG cell wall anchor domain-containing protein n=1 Tax=Streptomyces boluensis TaxID=1775135 RepID=A0A964XPR9_9ACTN|nr:lytic polysaccharide monooxygenase [Streptomyces boluensis]NBE55521.1 LPXTG cell wall anchor domain-containing protein [Streptomyces boluensis]